MAGSFNDDTKELNETKIKG
jgi:hypothetical protein